MFDFLKGNKTVTGALILGLIFVAIIFLIMLTAGGDTTNTVINEDDPIFANTDEERTFDPGVQNIFGPVDPEKWVEQEGSQEAAPFLRAITEDPVVSAVAFTKTNGVSNLPYVRFTTLNDGNIHETPLQVVGTIEKISDLKTLRVGDVVWSRNGNFSLTRYLDNTNTEIATQLFDLRKGTSTEDVSRAISDTIISTTFSPDEKEFFSLVKTSEGVTGYLESVEKGTRTAVWSSIFKNVTVLWDAENKIVIYTNPSSVTEGVIWVLNPYTKKETVVLTGKRALAAKMSPDGKKLLYSMQEEQTDAFSLRTFDMETGEVFTLPLIGFVDKCTWAQSDSNNIYCAIPKEEIEGEFMEKWYMGAEYTNDTLWRIDAESGTTKELLDPEEETGETFDITNLSVDPGENYLVFTSRVNRALWSFKLSGTAQ